MDKMRILLTIATICGFNFLMAQSHQVAVQSHPESEIFKVFFQAELEYDVKIRLKSRSGRTLLEDKVYANGFMKPFNLTNLPDGEYMFHVDFGDERYQQKVILGTPKIAKEKVKKDRRSRTKISQDRILISENDKDIRIAVVDEGIEALSIFFYLEDTDDFEYFYWEPTDIKEQHYKMSQFNASQIRVEVVENGKILAEKDIAKNW